MEGDGYAVGHLDALGEGYGFRKIRTALGVTAFGVNAIVLPPGIEAGSALPRRAGGALLRAQRRARDGVRRRLHPPSRPRRPGPRGPDDRAPVPQRRRRGRGVRVVGGKDGYVGRDGHVPEDETGEVRARSSPSRPAASRRAAAAPRPPPAVRRDGRQARSRCTPPIRSTVSRLERARSSSGQGVITTPTGSRPAARAASSVSSVWLIVPSAGARGDHERQVEVEGQVADQVAGRERHEQPADALADQHVRVVGQRARVRHQRRRLDAISPASSAA